MAKRGRPKASETESKEAGIVKAAFEELVAKGYEKTTMLGIAKRAGASKETLYSKFSNKQGLFAALIKFQADKAVEGMTNALSETKNAKTTLSGFGFKLLKLLLGEPSVSLNRAAMSSPELAAVLLQYGRYTAGPITEKYLEKLANEGQLKIKDTGVAFQIFYGLVIQDLQIRVLLGEACPTDKVLKTHAQNAIEKFWLLYT